MMKTVEFSCLLTQIQDNIRAQKKALMLPESCTTVPPVALRRDYPPISQLQGPNKGECQRIPEETVKEYRYSWQKSFFFDIAFLGDCNCSINNCKTDILFVQFTGGCKR